MIKILSSKQMSYADKFTSESRFIPSLVLMERAALCTCEEIEKIVDRGHIGVLCGVGNNGGDGMAVVRILRQHGYSVSYYVLGDINKASESAKTQLESLKSYGFLPEDSIDALISCDLLVDAVFGTGLSRDVDDDFVRIFTAINKWNIPKIAVDIPSGINATTGALMGSAIKCDMTVTFAYSKIGHFLYPGKDYCGQVVVKDIGITDECLPKEGIVKAFEKEDLPGLLPNRANNSHKGTFGKLLVIAGSRNRSGAAYFAAKSAYLVGAGLVKVLTEESNRIILQQLLPEAMLTTYSNYCPKELILDELLWADAVVVGPGLGLSKEKRKLLGHLFELAKCPIVCDADALSIISKKTSLLEGKNAPVIVTPHLGEMSRLTGENVSDIQSDLIKKALDFSRKYNSYTILKSASTIITTPEAKRYINIYGNNGMSTGGSGDVLSGILGGLLAQNMDLEKASILGVALHSLAGDEARKYVGTYAMKAEDIIEGLILTIKEAEKEKQHE